MFYSYFLILNTILLVNSKFETSCNSSQFHDLENLIGSLHRYAPNHNHLIVRDMGLTMGQRRLLERYENIQIISSKSKQKETNQIINIKHEFILLNKVLSTRPNKGQYNYVDFIRKRFYLAIVIPYIKSQLNSLIDQLNLHETYSPCENQSNSIDLIFYFNEKQIPHVKYHNKCFRNIRFLSADLSEQENQYPIGSAMMWKKLFINERSNNISLRYHGYTHFFLMEPDTRPIRSYWLDAIVEQIINGHNRASYISTQWWMTGSVYRGFESIGQNFLHINGNALYHLSLNFIDFLSYVSNEYPYDSKETGGYDLDLFVYLFKNLDKAKQYWHKFQFSDFIQNCWHTGCNETQMEFLYNNPNTYLIHGNKIDKNSLKTSSRNSSKISDEIIVILIVILFFVFILKQWKYFCWILSYKRRILLRGILK
jgi:hypothetical protein